MGRSSGSVFKAQSFRHAGPTTSMPQCVHFSSLPQLCSAPALPGSQVCTAYACLTASSTHSSACPFTCTDVIKQEDSQSGRGFRAVRCNAELDVVRCLVVATGHLQRLLADARGPVSSRQALLAAVLRSLHLLQRALAHMQQSSAASKLTLAAAEGTCRFGAPPQLLLASCVLQELDT